MIRKSSWIAMLVGGLFAVSCTSDPLDIDASNEKVTIDFINVNDPIMHADSAKLIEVHKQFKKDIKDIYAYFVGYCLNLGEISDTAFYNSIQLFREDKGIQELNGYIEKEFSDTQKIEKDVTDGFKHLKYHIKDCKIPEHIVYLNSLFRSGVFCTENEIGIGLQQYLGADNPIIQKLDPQFYFEWMKEGFDRVYLIRDVLTGWIETHLVEEADGNLAEQIIRWGKIIYLTEAAFPAMEKHLILRYTKEDLDWAEENEYSFWKYLVDENLLFKEDEKVTRNMIGDGPFTAGIPEEGSPDRMGQFIGWKMVHSYMENNDVSVAKMIQASYNEILQDYEIE